MKHRNQLQNQYKQSKAKCIQIKHLVSLGKLISTLEALEQFNKISAIHIKQTREDYARHNMTVKQICSNFRPIQESLKYFRCNEQ